VIPLGKGKVDAVYDADPLRVSGCQPLYRVSYLEGDQARSRGDGCYGGFASVWITRFSWSFSALHPPAGISEERLSGGKNRNPTNYKVVIYG